MLVCRHFPISAHHLSRLRTRLGLTRAWVLGHVPLLMLSIMLAISPAGAQSPTASEADPSIVTMDTEANGNADRRRPPFTEPMIAGFARFHAERPTNTRRAGQLLVSELSCTACHHTPESQLAPKRGPTLEGLASRLDLNWVRSFLRQPQGVKPGTTMPDLFAEETPADREAKIESLVFFLASLEEQPEHFQLKLPPLTIVHPQFWERGDAERGRVWYHQVGCVACHAPDAENHDEPSLRVPEQQQQLRELGLNDEEIVELLAETLPDPAPTIQLPDLAPKYTPRSLAFFLLDPLAIRPAGRMPHLQLSPEEAADLATYLLGPDRLDTSPHPPADGGIRRDDQTRSDSLSAEKLLEAGRHLFQSVGCVNCHPLPNVMATGSFPDWGDLPDSSGGHCQAQTDSVSIPSYPLSSPQQAALSHLLSGPMGIERDEESRQSLGEKNHGDSDSVNGEDSPDRFTEQLKLTLEKLNCLACHRRDGRGGVGSDRWSYFMTINQIDLGDEGRIPPPLDRVGWKLTTPWLTQVLADGAKVRPHMLARMPRFGTENVEHLPMLLAVVDQPSPTARRPVSDKTTSEKGTTDKDASEDAVSGNVEAGRRLLDVGCIQCHPLHGERLPGVIGIDLGGIRGRIQQDWFREFVLDPAAWKDRTRMPTFFPGGVSNSPEIAGGDVSRQLASLWEYLHSTDNVPLPDRLEAERLHNFELVPESEPIVLRTFMKEAGTHAVAVGYPGKLSLAFDTWQTRPAIAWKGAFLDAHSIWFDRFSPPTPPLGDEIISFARGPLLARLPSVAAAWPDHEAIHQPGGWKGYHLDEKRIPTFRYLGEQYLIGDRFEPLDDGEGLRRRIVIEPNPNEPQRGEAADEGESLWCRLHAGEGIERSGDEGVHEVTDSRGLRVKLVTPIATEDQLVVRRIKPLDSPGEPTRNSTRPSEDSAITDDEKEEGVKYEWILRIPRRVVSAVPSLPDSGKTPSEGSLVLEIEYRW